MGRGIVNIVIGGAFVVGGLSGRLALIGTNSGWPLVVLGVVFVGLGIWRIRAAKQAAPPPA
jgi:hypothetical protein